MSLDTLSVGSINQPQRNSTGDQFKAGFGEYARKQGLVGIQPSIQESERTIFESQPNVNDLSSVGFAEATWFFCAPAIAIKGIHLL